MQIHELNDFTGTLGSGAYLAIDNGTDTGKISSEGLLAATEARIDNIIAGPAPSAEEIVDARLGADGVTYPSLGDAIRDQFTDVKSDLSECVNLLIGSQSGLNSNSGLLLLPTKKNDSITVKRTDGQPFAQSDQLRFYDANGTYIYYWGLGSTYGSKRTFTYNKDTPAMYIGLTKVGDSVIDYDVINNTAKRIPSKVNDILAELNNIVTFDSSEWSIGSLQPSTGAEVTSTTRVRSPYINAIKGDVITYDWTSDGLIVYCFNANKEYISDSAWSDGNRFEVSDASTKFVRILLRKDGTTSAITSEEKVTMISKATMSKIIPKATYNIDEMVDDVNSLKTLSSDTSSRVDLLEILSAKKDVINRFNKATIEAGKYISTTTGNLVSGDSFFASDFIYIGDLASITVSYTHIFCWYDENKNHLTPNPDPMNSGSADLTFTRPQNAVYLRFSAYNANLNKAQIGASVSRDNYVAYGIYKLSDLKVYASQIDYSDASGIIVDASGNGDYTSFTEAIYETVDSGIDVFVRAGTYNIVSEYIALFGQEAVDSMADDDSSTFDGFQFGVRLRNRKVEFASGAHLVCDWTGHIVNGTHRFSALAVGYDVEIIGLDLDATATFYAIHDDYGISTRPYTVKYVNCRVIGHDLKNVNCIGGGCKKWSRHIIENCYFDNNTEISTAVRYHNTNSDGAEPEVFVSNSYIYPYLKFNYYGDQTTKMRAYVNNCYAKAIYKDAESSSYTTDNVELYKWCNTETNPRD